MTDPIAFVLSIVVLVASFLTHPQRATCPGAYHVATAQLDGFYACRLTPPERGPVEPYFAIVGRVYCTSGHRAVNRAWERVECD